MKKTGRRRLVRRANVIVGGAAVLGIALIAGAVSAATLAAHPATDATAAVAFAAAAPSASVPSTSAPSRPPAPTRTPVHTPVVTTHDEAVPEAMPFERATVEDSSMAQGQTAVTTPGRDGERMRTYRVTLTDGVETARELISDVVTAEPVTEVTSVGTYVEPVEPAPPAAAEPPAGSGDCDPNYADACVPIASDVDCAGGRGNGPAYFDGVARVVGSDIYGLDGDGDGWACNGSR